MAAVPWPSIVRMPPSQQEAREYSPVVTEKFGCRRAGSSDRRRESSEYDTDVLKLHSVYMIDVFEVVLNHVLGLGLSKRMTERIKMGLVRRKEFEGLLRQFMFEMPSAL